MIIGVLKEIKPNEYRVAATPGTVKEIVARGHQVLVEKDAGKGSGYSDAEYVAAGATVLDTAEEVFKGADLFYKVKEMFPQEWKYMNKDKIVYTYIHSNAHPEETDAILSSKVTAIAYEDITDKDGNFPLLKPMSILAGKGGFLAALHHMQSVFGGNGTLLANVCGIDAPVVSIIGAGNSGIGAAELAAGFGNVVASMGTALTKDQARILKRYVEKVLICYDGDFAGQKASIRYLWNLPKKTNNQMVRKKIQQPYLQQNRRNE